MYFHYFLIILPTATINILIPQQWTVLFLADVHRKIMYVLFKRHSNFILNIVLCLALFEYLLSLLSLTLAILKLSLSYKPCMVHCLVNTRELLIINTSFHRAHTCLHCLTLFFCSLFLSDKMWIGENLSKSTQIQTLAGSVIIGEALDFIELEKISAISSTLWKAHNLHTYLHL